jgi:hypothetical protein
MEEAQKSVHKDFRQCATMMLDLGDLLTKEKEKWIIEVGESMKRNAVLIFGMFPPPTGTCFPRPAARFLTQTHFSDGR